MEGVAIGLGSLLSPDRIQPSYQVAAVNVIFGIQIIAILGILRNSGIKVPTVSAPLEVDSLVAVYIDSREIGQAAGTAHYNGKVGIVQDIAAIVHAGNILFHLIGELGEIHCILRTQKGAVISLLFLGRGGLCRLRFTADIQVWENCLNNLLFSKGKGIVLFCQII